MTAEVKDWIAHHAMVRPDARATVDLASGREYSFAGMNQRIGRVAAHLKSIGIQPGDRIGYLALNSTDLLETIFGTWRIGGISLALNFRLTVSELEFIIKDAGPKAILVDRAFAQLAEGLKPLTSVEHWIETDGMGGESDYESALAAAEPLLENALPQPITDQCMLMYSSGTTGLPKGVIITHEMLAYSALNALVFTDLGPGNACLVSMPIFHIGGLNVFCLPMLCGGGAAVIQRIFDPEKTLDAFSSEDLGITHFLGVPAIFNALKMHPKHAETDFSGLRLVVAGAEAVPDALVRWWYEEKGLKIQEGYGMTETVASSCLVGAEDVPDRIGTAGRPLMYSDMKIVDEKGEEVPRGEIGEIWMRGAVITPGYWKREKSNAESFVDGWFRSGDVGRQDEEGYIYIEDRVKDMYISGGENVYPAEVENALYQLPQIAEVAVIGVADSQWGEVGCVVVVFKEGQEISLEQILAHCEDRLARFKHPRHLHRMDALPRNATGKVLKYQLRQTVPEQLELR